MNAHAAFLLEILAVAGAAATLTSVAARGLLVPAKRARLAASARADLAFAAGLLPAAAGTVVLAGLAAAATIGPEHCLSHLHHTHLCPVHFPHARTAATVPGLFFLCALLLRGARLLRAERRLAGQVRELTALGHPDGAAPRLVRIPTQRPVCLTAGILRPRVLVSQGFARALPPCELEAAVAHEDAHVRRRDPLALLLLSLAGLAAPPSFVRAVLAVYRPAVEEAADAEAAREAGNAATLASALVSVARLSLRAPAGALGIGEPSLEVRVRRLLEPGGQRTAAPRMLAVAVALGLAAAALSLALSAPLHHAVESAMHAIL